MSDWQRVQKIFLECVDLPAHERACFLQDSCVEDAELLFEVNSLIKADLGSGEAIEAAVQEEAAHLFDSQVMIGERLGTYRIVREIGRGGMGSVYLALRDDREFDQEVALKIVKRGMDTAEVLERFRYERQILANLDHPNIARLFDGGTTADGVPFFVMEYIEGRPIDVYCREEALNFDARCRLFLNVLQAVDYAHRNLVVHRDLKPTNIYVTAAGSPKLLDFGVAKVIEGNSDAGQTVTAVTRHFTPGYASPEQVSGTRVTTSTDIYSLGAVLYELLTGRRAHSIDVQTPAEIERAVCETEIIRPSLLVKGLPSDLDNIVLMAMRKEPERRYQSAAQFAEDIHRYLVGRPVIARQDSLTYRVGKFVLRNRLQVAMAMMVVAALVGGLIISLAQARRAEAALRNAESQRVIAVRETSLAEAARLSESQQKAVADQQRSLAEKERDQAEGQKRLAERRVKDILVLANRTLFDVHDAIAPLAGSVAARQTVVKTTLEYLESLQKEIGDDDEMREALTAAYYKIAMIQGDTHAASLQDFQGSEQSLLKAQAIILPAYRRHPHDAGMILRWIEVRSSLADLMYRSGRQSEGLQMLTDLIPVTQALSRIEPCNLPCKTQEAVLENALVYDLMSTNPKAALEHADRGIMLDRQLVAQYPNEASLKQGLGSLTAAAAGAYKNLGDLEKSGEYYRQSIEVREELLNANPNDSTIRRNLLVAYGNYAALLGVPWSQNLGRPEQARLYAGKGVALAREMVQADKNDGTARHDLGMSLSRLGMIDPDTDGTAASLAILQESRSLIEPIFAANPKSAESANQIALILEYEGHRLKVLGRNTEAIASYQRSMALLKLFLTQPNNPGMMQVVTDEQDLALLYASIGDHVAASESANSAFAAVQRYNALSPPTESRLAALAGAWAVLAITRSKAGETEHAQEAADEAMKLWNSVKTPGILTVYRKSIAETQTLIAAQH